MNLNERIHTHRSELFVAAVSVSSNCYKVFQIIFQKRDGSLFVNFPYFESSDGIVSLATFKPGLRTRTLDLKEGGKITSHLVKYSHHPDGRVHFSQSGKVIQSVGKMSSPIKKTEGHEFSIQLQGLNSFTPAKSDELISKPNDNRTFLKYDLGRVQPEALKFVAHWHSYEDMHRRLSGEVCGPITTLQNKDGESWRAFLLSAPNGHPAEKRILTLSCSLIQKLTKDETALTFVGGFDPPQIVNDLTRETSFLALSYPVNNRRDLENKIGSIDLK